MIGRWLLSLFLRLPYLLGMLCGLIAVCAVALWVLVAAAYRKGYHRVYDGQ